MVAKLPTHTPRALNLRILALAALLVPVLAMIVGATEPARAQQVPAMQITTYQCPDDVSYGDNLAQTCTTPRTGVDLKLDGPQSATATTDDTGRATVDTLDRGTYAITDGSVRLDQTSLVECDALQGMGGLINLKVTPGNGPGVFSVDLTHESGKVGTADACTWYLIPAKNVQHKAAGLVVDAGEAPQGGVEGLVIVPADGTELPISGAGPALPAQVPTDFRLTWDTTMTTSQQFGTVKITAKPDEPNGSANHVFPTAGPILLQPVTDQDPYVLDDTTNGFETRFTVGPSEVVHIASLAPSNTASASGSALPALSTGGAASPGGSSMGPGVTFDGTSLHGAYTDLDPSYYGTQAAALYGEESDYATGTLTFDYPGAVDSQRTTISLLGLDDELERSEPISVTLNGIEVYNGESTFHPWDPNATDLQWSHLVIEADPGILKPNGNTLAITDLANGSHINQPPWVMITLITITQSH